MSRAGAHHLVHMVRMHMEMNHTHVCVKLDVTNGGAAHVFADNGYIMAPLATVYPLSSASRTTSGSAYRYTRLKNLAWSHFVF